VIVEADRSATGLWRLLPALTSVLGPIVTAGVGLLLVIYLLVMREDL
jgi:hypothetical protein